MKTFLIILLVVVALVALFLAISIILELRRRQRNQIDRIMMDKIVDNVLQYWEPGHADAKPKRKTKPAGPCPDLVIDPSVPSDEEHIPKYLNRVEEAARLVVASQNSVRSNLQRKLRIGYAHAGQILEQLEAIGVVGPENGDQPREVLIKDCEELERICSQFIIHEESNGNDPDCGAKKTIDDLYWDLSKD